MKSNNNTIIKPLTQKQIQTIINRTEEEQSAKYKKSALKAVYKITKNIKTD